MTQDPNKHVVGAVLAPSEAHCLLFDLLSLENEANENEGKNQGAPSQPRLSIHYRFSGESRELAEASTEPLEFTQAVPWKQPKQRVRSIKS